MVSKKMLNLRRFIREYGWLVLPTLGIILLSIVITMSTEAKDKRYENKQEELSKKFDYCMERNEGELCAFEGCNVYLENGADWSVEHYKNCLLEWEIRNEMRSKGMP